jgi:hypothetical protein
MLFLEGEEDEENATNLQITITARKKVTFKINILVYHVLFRSYTVVHFCLIYSVLIIKIIQYSEPQERGY